MAGKQQSKTATCLPLIHNYFALNTTLALSPQNANISRLECKEHIFSLVVDRPPPQSYLFVNSYVNPDASLAWLYGNFEIAVTGKHLPEDGQGGLDAIEISRNVTARIA